MNGGGNGIVVEGDVNNGNKLFPFLTDEVGGPGRAGGGAGSGGGNLYNWVDVTKEFFSSCRELNLGELLHDSSNFGLLDAMSAIELMDPKMDAGMNQNRRRTPPYTFTSGAKDGKLILDSQLDLRDKIGMIDESLGGLVSWLGGHSLAQTLFTNLYFHRPLEIRGDLTLKGFSIAILKLIDIIKEIINRGGVFEEEDFQPGVYGFCLYGNISEVRCGGMLKEVEDEIQKSLRALSKKDESEEDKPEIALLNAVFIRIRFLRLFYNGLVHINKNDTQEALKYFKAIPDQITAIKSTIDLGTPLETTDGFCLGFEPLANQRLLPPTFPRYVELKTREESILYLKDVVSRILSATYVTQIPSFHATLDFFIDFGSKSPCVLSRSVLQCLYQPLQTYHRGSQSSVSSGGGGPFTFQDLLREACKSFIAPPVLVSNKTPPFNGQQIKDCLYSFFSQCCRPMGLFLQTFGHNRARQREKIAHLLEEFASVQEEADKLDTMLNTLTTESDMLFFSTWLLYYVLKLMVRYILSGFELELYSTHEYAYLYWYLFELLYPWLTTCLHRADTYLVKQEQINESQAKKSGNKKKSKTGRNKKTQGLRPYAREITYYQGYAILCAGYFKLLVGLKKEGSLNVPSTEFDKDQVRYEHRFGPFSNLMTPPLMPYSQYTEVYQHMSAWETTEIFSAAGKDFARSRQMFETVIGTFSQQQGSSNTNSVQEEEFHNLITVTKNNFVVSNVLSKDPKRKLEFDFTFSKTFPTCKFN